MHNILLDSRSSEALTQSKLINSRSRESPILATPIKHELSGGLHLFPCPPLINTSSEPRVQEFDNAGGLYYSMNQKSKTTEKIQERDLSVRVKPRLYREQTSKVVPTQLLPLDLEGAYGLPR